MTRLGATIAELIVGIVVGSLVTTAAVRVLVTQQHYYREMARSVAAGRTVAAAGALFTAEFAPLAPVAPGGGDLIDVGPTSIRYRALRQLYVVCRPPSRGLELTVGEDLIASDPLDLAYDSLLIWGESDDGRRIWIHADPVGITDADCPGGRPGRAIRLARHPEGLRVEVGGPVRAGPVVEIRAYPARGAHWLGMRTIAKRGRPASIEPVVGPFEPGGVRFVLVDRAEREVTDPTRAAGIVVFLTPLGWRVRNPVRDPVPIHVAFRGSPP